MLLKLLLSLLGGDQQETQSKRTARKTKSELRREKDRRDYELWVMAEEYMDDDDE